MEQVDASVREEEDGGSMLGWMILVGLGALVGGVVLCVNTRSMLGFVGSAGETYALLCGACDMLSVAFIGVLCFGLDWRTDRPGLWMLPLLVYGAFRHFSVAHDILGIGVFLAMFMIAWAWYLVLVADRVGSERAIRLGWVRTSLFAGWVGVSVDSYYPKAPMTTLIHGLAPGHPEMVRIFFWGSGLLACALGAFYVWCVLDWKEKEKS